MRSLFCLLALLFLSGCQMRHNVTPQQHSHNVSGEQIHRVHVEHEPQRTDIYIHRGGLRARRLLRP